MPVANLLSAIAQLLWPIVVAVLIFALLSLMRGLIKGSDSVDIEVGGARITVQRAAEDIRKLINDLQDRLNAIEGRRRPEITKRQVERTFFRVQARFFGWTSHLSALTEDFDIPRPYARAPRQRARRILAQYRETAQATGQTVDRLGQIASAAQAPSRVLATARAATVAVPASRQPEDRDHRTGQERQGPGQDSREMAGPLERTLRRLGVDQPELIARGAELDRTAERLLVDAGNLDPARKRPAATPLNQSTATAALVNHALASGDPRATALLRRPGPAQAEQAEPEP